MKKLKKPLLILLVVFAAIQFIQPAKNISTETSPNKIAASEEVRKILAKSCNDCHSNNTVYPWYNNIQPVAWWLARHVDDGKRHLNFDEFYSYNLARQYHKLEETEEMLATDEMPLNSYTWTHRDAILSSEEKQTLIDWTQTLRKEMEATYPKDSLVLKRLKQ